MYKPIAPCFFIIFLYAVHVCIHCICQWLINEPYCYYYSANVIITMQSHNFTVINQDDDDNDDFDDADVV